jgi:hypothetical protein
LFPCGGQGKTKELVGRIEDLRAADLCNLGTVYPNVLHGKPRDTATGPTDEPRDTATGPTDEPRDTATGPSEEAPPVVIDVKYTSVPATARLEPDNLLEVRHPSP